MPMSGWRVSLPCRRRSSRSRCGFRSAKSYSMPPLALRDQFLSLLVRDELVVAAAAADVAAAAAAAAAAPRTPS